MWMKRCTPSQMMMIKTMMKNVDNIKLALNSRHEKCSIYLASGLNDNRADGYDHNEGDYGSDNDEGVIM